MFIELEVVPKSSRNLKSGPSDVDLGKCTDTCHMPPMRPATAGATACTEPDLAWSSESPAFSMVEESNKPYT